MNLTSSDLNKWFVCPRSTPRASFRLFIFPHAGGGPAPFSKWSIPSTIEAWIAHYPGRGSRYKEPLVTRINALVDGLAEAIPPLLDKPFAFFGHSLGGLVAFELAKGKQPNILFVSGCGAPSLPNPHPHIHRLPDSDFIDALKKFNGIPDEVIANPEMMSLFLPILHADFEAFETYRPNSHRLDCPIIALSGLDDSRVSREQVEGWALHTENSFESKYFAGDHFFIATANKAVLKFIEGKLR